MLTFTTIDGVVHQHNACVVYSVSVLMRLKSFQ